MREKTRSKFPTRWSHHSLPLLKQRSLKAVTRTETVRLVPRHQLLHWLQYHTQLQAAMTAVKLGKSYHICIFYTSNGNALQWLWHINHHRTVASSTPGHSIISNKSGLQTCFCHKTAQFGTSQWQWCPAAEKIIAGFRESVGLAQNI